MKPALAIFAKTPRPGQVKTRLTPPLTLQQGADLYRCMLLDTIARARTLPVEIVIFFDGEESFFRQTVPSLPLVRQQGPSLGNRLEHAFSTLSTLGFAPSVVIGSDAPDLPLPFVEQAFELLYKGKEVVFGPADDGGYYLVGMRGGFGTVFSGIPWSGPLVLETSLARAEEDGLSAALLPPWYDVDCFEDLCRPGLSDPGNGAPLTRRFIRGLGVTSLDAAGAI